MTKRDLDEKKIDRRVRFRIGLFALGGAAMLTLLVWAFLALPRSGHYRGPYGDIINRSCGPERHVTDAVSAVNFDYRAFDTLGEEFILFTSVLGVVLLLRDPEKGKDRHQQRGERDRIRDVPRQSDAVRLLTLALTGATVVYGVYVVAHGQLTPGGGFQGGVVLSTAPLLVYLAGSATLFRKVAPPHLVETAEALAAGMFVLVGLAGLLVGAELLYNFLPHGPYATVISGGTIALISWITGLEVAAGFVLLLTTFLAKTLSRDLEDEKK